MGREKAREREASVDGAGERRRPASYDDGDQSALLLTLSSRRSNASYTASSLRWDAESSPGMAFRVVPNGLSAFGRDGSLAQRSFVLARSQVYTLLLSRERERERGRGTIRF
jgi:hypothetical protein